MEYKREKMALHQKIIEKMKIAQNKITKEKEIEEEKTKSMFYFLFFVKSQKTKEEPKMEENLDYGMDDEYYDEHDNRVEDRNEYYE